MFKNVHSIGGKVIFVSEKHYSFIAVLFVYYMFQYLSRFLFIIRMLVK